MYRASLTTGLARGVRGGDRDGVAAQDAAADPGGRIATTGDDIREGSRCGIDTATADRRGARTRTNH